MKTPRLRYQKAQPTSRDGAESAAATLPDSCRAVLNVIRALGGASIAEIANYLGWDKSTVSARVSQLRDDLLRIEDSGVRRRSTTRVAGIVWIERREYAHEHSGNVLHSPTIAAPEVKTPTTQLTIFGGGR